VVWGRGIAAAIAGEVRAAIDTVEVPASALGVRAGADGPLAEHRRLLWDRAGVVRDADGLAAGRRAVDALAGAAAEEVRARNAGTVAGLVFDFALERRESRGAHHRSDFPASDPVFASRRVVVPMGEPTVRLQLRGERAAPVTLVAPR
jgi:aspartate oxidase